jgi:5-formyltetrahydrofolate cyclo-ligase
MDKQIVRKTVFRSRQQLVSSDHVRLSRQIQERFQDQPYFQQAQTLGLYSAINREVATDLLGVVALRCAKQISYPRVVGADLYFHQVAAADELQSGAFGVAEPSASANCIAIEDLDLLVVPGVAFDVRGYRLGYGKGFYDRYLVGRPQSLTTVGFAFEFQLFEQLPVEEHDQPLDYIVTETRVIPCRNDAAGSL